MSVYQEHDDDDEDADHEAPDDADVYAHGGASGVDDTFDEAFDDASVDTVRCPYCGKAVYEQAEVCHHCKSYLSIEDRPPRKPTWVVVAVLLCLLGILVGWLFTKPFSG